MLIPNLHYIIYDSHMPMTKKLHSDTIQLLCKFINVNNLLYTCKYNETNRQFIMWCFHNSICNKHCVWIWSWKISICFDTNANTFTKLHKQKYIFPFPKYLSFLYKNPSSLVERNSVEPRFVNDSLSIKSRI